ncbi:unnamed protein product [Rotaria sp. Silwood2]|nr:unnamed protein product [Rotaria sp. Silwood2]CAF2797823.1 unnamed protein product [Rotaria sp. Silwood2]CAF4125744.1 unnamed protein product [Rotaria sp. Silwood2]CAF4465879.1 unnamed protein product [Rotaria sp. Silwood2]
MEYSCVGFNDLPDEILMIIFKKMNNFEVLYSLQGVNQRLNKIVQDSPFTSRWTFVKRCSDNFIDVFRYNMMFNRFCSQILPEIHDKIKWLDLESSSMNNVLCAVDYPNLYGLGLYNINEESARSLITDETLSSGIFKNQIRTLFITIDNNDDSYEGMFLWSTRIVNYILNACTSIIYLTLYESLYKNRVRLLFDDEFLPTFRSSTLLKLNIRVQCFDDCLYLLDGRFNQLHTLCVDLVHINHPEEIKNQGDLPNLKCFSLSCYLAISFYDELILPLLYRMSNLEQLGLYIATTMNTTFIDGNHLKRDIINRMSLLNQFTFYIHSFIFISNQLYCPSTENIQRTFIDFLNNNIISYVDYFPEAKQCQCHIYSYPSFTPYYDNITNNFPGGLYKYVRVISLFDEYPFEHEFFLRIQKSFPFVQELIVINYKS